MRRRHHSPASGLFFGGVIVAIGLLLLLDNMHIIRMRDVWQYWPLLLVVFGLSRIVECHTPSSLIWGGLVALIGGLIFLDNLYPGMINFNFIWPLIIIAFGLTLLWKALERRKSLDGVDVSTDPSTSMMAIFGGTQRKIAAQDFKGGDALAIFGGLELDLRGAKMAGDRAVLDVNATFGGVELRVPESWHVEVKTVAVFGGVDDKTIPPKSDPNTPAPCLVLTGTTVFGGVSVRN
jgi:predicted membrane protein